MKMCGLNFVPSVLCETYELFSIGLIEKLLVVSNLVYRFAVINKSGTV